MTVTYRLPLTFTVALILAATASAGAQSLGDAARQEAQRRQTVKAAPKTLTNKDLPSAPQPSSPPESAAGASDAQTTAADATANDQTGQTSDAAATADGQQADGKDDQGDGKAETGGSKDQAYWSRRMKDAREALRRDQTLADAMQSRINALTTDFVNRGDPVQRAQIGQQRQTALDELDRLNKSITKGTKALGDLEEEARRAGVPAGWLR